MNYLVQYFKGRIEKFYKKFEFAVQRNFLPNLSSRIPVLLFLNHLLVLWFKFRDFLLYVFFFFFFVLFC